MQAKTTGKHHHGGGGLDETTIPMQRLHGKCQLHCKQMPFQANAHANLPTTGWVFRHATAKMQVDGALVRNTHCLCNFTATGWEFAKKSKAFRLALCELLTSTILSFLLRILPAKSALRPASVCTSLSCPMGWACCKRKRLPAQSRCRPCNTAKCH